MQVPLQISFRNMHPSDAVEARVREKAARLEKYFDRIISCRVIVEAPHRHHRKGKLYTVRIDLTVPGRELVVTRNNSEDHAHEDVYVALRDAFNAAARQLEDHARKARGEVKTHETPLAGKVARLFPQQGYGFVELTDGREIHFHQNAVVSGQFEKLNVGAEVRLVVAYDESPHGPQASTVTPIGKHHIVE